VKGYARSGTGAYTQQTPLDRLVDAVPPESDAARAFGHDVDALLADPEHASGCATIATRLQAWCRLHDEMAPVLAGAPALREAEPLVDDLAGLGELGLRALAALASEDTLRLGFGDAPLLARAPSPRAELLLMVAPHVARLVAGATGGKP
jgi:hexosaminidase